MIFMIACGSKIISLANDLKITLCSLYLILLLYHILHLSYKYILCCGMRCRYENLLRNLDLKMLFNEESVMFVWLICSLIMLYLSIDYASRKVVGVKVFIALVLMILLGPVSLAAVVGLTIYNWEEE